MTAISGAAQSPSDRHSTAPAARTALLTGTVSGGASFGTSNPAGHPGSPHRHGRAHGDVPPKGAPCSPRIVIVTDAGGVPSTTPDDRAPSHPLAATRSSDRQRPAPSTGSRGPLRTRRRRQVERSV